jgi:putative endonuclease
LRTYYTYILTNQSKNVLYVGMTNNLCRRLTEHYFCKGTDKSFTGRYYCYYLLYFEEFNKPMDAIRREKEIKKWNRQKKESLIATMNPGKRFLNADLMPWPPHPNSIPDYLKE